MGSKLIFFLLATIILLLLAGSLYSTPLPKRVTDKGVQQALSQTSPSKNFYLKQSSHNRIVSLYSGPSTTCPENFRNDGLYCAKPSAYGRGAGYVIWEEQKCRNRHPVEGCEKSGAIWYPKCKANFHPVGCCVCSPNCPSGWTDIGVSCAKPYGGQYPEPVLALNDADAWNSENLFQFVAKEGEWGYVVHIPSGKVWKPANGARQPVDGTRFVLADRSQCTSVCYFRISTDEKIIQHISGSYVMSTAGNKFDHLVIGSVKGTNSYWQLYDENRNLYNMDTEQTKVMDGYWILLYAHSEPTIAEHTATYTVRKGFSQSKSKTMEFSKEYGISQEIGFDFIGLKMKTAITSKFGSKVSNTDSETWSKEITRSTTFKVPIGRTIAIWQWVFKSSYYNDEFDFSSNIMADTDNINIMPKNFV